MPITKLNTFEGVPIGKENFEEYTGYLSDLVARSNPFIETTINDFNRVVVLGSGQVSILSDDEDNLDTATLVIESSLGESRKFFSYRPSSYIPRVLTADDISIGQTFTFADSPDETGKYLLRVEVSEFAAGDLVGTLSLTINSQPVSYYSNLNGTDVSFYNVSLSELANFSASTFYFPIDYLDANDSPQISFSIPETGSGAFSLKMYLYRYEPWEQDKSYLINYSLFNSVFASGLFGKVNVYYGNEIDIYDYVINGTDVIIPDGVFRFVDTLDINANNDTLGSVLFRPDSSDANGALIFVADAEPSVEFSVPVSVDFYSFTDSDLITLSGSGVNSFAFLSDDDRRLFSIRTDYLLGNDSQTPGVRKWEVPMGSVSELFFAPGDIGYGFQSSLFPDVFSSFNGSFSEYNLAKTDKLSGNYKKGFLLTTINGIPQVQDDQISTNTFFEASRLESMGVYQLKSLRLGSEYATPKYTRRGNHQYARQVIEGFTGINSTFVFGESLASQDFQNTLFFPFTDFLLNPTLLLIYKNPEGNERYYYIPKDEDFSPENTVKKNHYKVIDSSSGEVRFNFSLPFPSGGNNRYWIVSAEQLTESTTNNVTDYFSSYGKMYSPTANLGVSTKIIAFDPVLLSEIDFNVNLPEIPLIPSTKIISSSGGPLISDAEGEFSNLVIYGISYPGQINADEFVRNQANKFEPDVFVFYYYCGTTGFEVTPSPSPRTTYVKLTQNDISWYNSGINRVTYDPVSRATFSEICVLGNSINRPINGVKIQDLKRRSSLATFVGTIGPENTNFMLERPRANSFLYGNSNNQIDSIQANKGSLLIGTDNNPSPLSVGSSGQVLTAGADNSVLWDRVRVPSFKSFSTGSTLINSTDGSILRINSTDNKLSIFASQIIASDVITDVFITLASDLRVDNLEVLGNVSLPITGVVSGSYGNTTNIPQVNIGVDGRIISATNTPIDNNFWKFIKDASDNIITATHQDTLSVNGTLNQVVVGVFSSDVRVSLSENVTIPGRFTSRVLRISATDTLPSNIANGDVWNTSTASFIRLSGSDRQFAFVGGHLHTASDIASGTLSTPRGGTGQSTYSENDFLIGNANGSLSIGRLLPTTNRILITREGSDLRINADATTTNTAGKIVARDSSGNFSANLISANLFGNSTTATRLATPRTINGIPFDGSSDILVNSVSAASLAAGFGIFSTGVFNGSTNRTFSVSTDVVVTSGNQTISGIKTFSNTVVGSITGNADTVTNGVYTNVPQTITALKIFTVEGTSFRNRIDIASGGTTFNNSISTLTLSKNSTLLLSTDNTTLTAGTMVNVENSQTIGGQKTFAKGIIISNTTENISFVASGDGFKRGISGSVFNNDTWFLGGSNVSTNGFLEISTGVHGDEPIYVRQFMGPTVARTLTLLNESGHTIIPEALFIKASAKSTAATYYPVFDTDPTTNAVRIFYRTTSQLKTDLGVGDIDTSGFVTISGTQTIIGVKSFTQLIQGKITNASFADESSRWSSSRGFSIGGVTKFTNGSNDVSWSSSEIQGSHSHTVAWAGGTLLGPALSVQGGTSAVVPSAASNASGVVTTGAQTFSGNKTFNNTVSVSGILIIPIK
jgi:hypothetical protein